MSKATYKLTVRNTAFPLQQWLHEYATLLRYSTLSVLLRRKFLAIIEHHWAPDL